MPGRKKKQLDPSVPSAGVSSDSWDHILASLEEGLVIIDPKGCVSYLNQAAEQLIGLSRTQASGRSYREFFEFNPWAIAILQRIASSGYSRTAGEGKLNSRTLTTTPVRLTCSPIFTGEGEYGGLILMLHDLSYQKELAETEQREDRLTQLGVVAAGLAHEIKNPLAGIRGAAQLLQKRIKHDQSAVEYASVMLREIDRLSGLLEQLLNLTAAPPLEFHPVNVHKILTEVLLLERETLVSHQRIQTQFDPSLPDVQADEAQLTQVFRNLIQNALHAIAGRRGGELSIVTRMATNFHMLRLETHGPRGAPGRGRFLVIDFIDNGSGILPEHQSRLFTPFFTTKTKGTGLGLAVSQKIVTQHGGAIRVESDPGQGTVFHVYLPVSTR